MKHVIHLTCIEIEQAIRDYAAHRASDLGVDARDIKNPTGIWKLEFLHDCPGGQQSSQHALSAQISCEKKE